LEGSRPRQIAERSNRDTQVHSRGLQSGVIGREDPRSDSDDATARPLRRGQLAGFHRQVGESLQELERRIVLAVAQVREGAVGSRDDFRACLGGISLVARAADALEKLAQSIELWVR